MADINSIENLNIRRVIERGTAKILVQREDCILVFDEVSKALMIACDDAEETIRVLEANDIADRSLLMVSNASVGKILFEKYGYDEKMECFQMAYLDHGVSESMTDLFVREADSDDFPFISSQYDLISGDELKEVINRRNMLLGYTESGIVGFIGEHLEGSIGLLYILPEYRRKGYASELEKEMFRRTIAKGFIPFGQVEKSNEASIRLQESLGLTKSENTVLWMWR